MYIKGLENGHIKSTSLNRISKIFQPDVVCFHRFLPRAILAKCSPVLQNIILKQVEVYFDEFTDCLEGLLDCVDLLYGADVTLTMDNIQAVLKFGVLYKVSNMVACGLAWVKDELSMTNFFSFCRIGLFIKSVDCTEDKVLTGCKNFILNQSSSDLLEVSKSWPGDENVVSFLFDKDVLEVTLPTITSFINSEKKVSDVMDKIESLDLQKILHRNLSQFQEMTVKMNEVCETVPNLKRINRWMSTLGKHTIDNITTQEPAAKRIRFDSATILKSMKNKAWRTFDKNKILALDFRHNDDHFLYAEIVLDWIGFTKAPLLVVQELWGSIKQECLQCAYVHYLWRSFKSLSNLDASTTPKAHNEAYYRYATIGEYRNSDKIKDAFKKSSKQEISWMYKECLVATCEVKTPHYIFLKLTSATPCYKFAVEPEDKRNVVGHYHHERLKHYFGVVKNKDGTCVILSFVTNTISELFTKVRSSENIRLYCLLQF